MINDDDRHCRMPHFSFFQICKFKPTFSFTTFVFCCARGCVLSSFQLSAFVFPPHSRLVITITVNEFYGPPEQHKKKQKKYTYCLHKLRMKPICGCHFCSSVSLIHDIHNIINVNINGQLFPNPHEKQRNCCCSIVLGLI